MATITEMWKIDCKLASIWYKSDGDCNILCIIEMKSISRQSFYVHISCIVLQPVKYDKCCGYYMCPQQH